LFVANAELEIFICVEATIQGFKGKSYTDEEIEVILRRSRSVEIL